MRFSEVSIFGILISPFVPIMILSFITFLPIRAALYSTGLYKLIWHPALFDSSLYLILLAFVVVAYASL